MIIDDEPLARKRIRNLLSHYDDFLLIAEAKNGEEAISLIEMKKPELIFLDIQMPGKDGFHVLKDSKLSYQASIVIVSAYEQYAIKAFDIDATDYLLKPFDDERFEQSIHRVRQAIEKEKSRELQSKLFNLMKEVNQDKSYISSINYKENGIEHQINIREIVYFESEGNYIRCHKQSMKSHLIRQTMSELISCLNPQKFSRIHRQFIINKDFISSFRYLTQNHEFEIKLYDGIILKSSRSYYDSLCNFLND